MANGNMCYCEICGRTMDEGQFYLSRNIEKYPPNGRMNQCKKCMTMYVDNWDPKTFLPILEEVDVPYIKQEWDSILEKEVAKGDPTKITGMTILGKYLAKMRIKQFKDARWADSERLQEEADNRKRMVLRSMGNSEEEIEQTIANDAAREVTRPKGPKTASAAIPQEEENDEDDLALDLTEEEITALRLKWGKGYTHSEWVQMEQLYQDMCASYDIQTAGHKDTLKMICKTSLQANQAIDAHDVEGFQKLSRVYDLLMKSGKFTAAQNKDQSGEIVDSVGELIAMCEKQGFIERYYIEKPEDVVDLTLADLKSYNRRLVEDEAGLGEQIEAATKKLLEAQANENKVDDDDEDVVMEDIDYEELRAQEEEQEEQDAEYMDSLSAAEGGGSYGSR